MKRQLIYLLSHSLADEGISYDLIATLEEVLSDQPGPAPHSTPLDELSIRAGFPLRQQRPPEVAPLSDADAARISDRFRRATRQLIQVVPHRTAVYPTEELRHLLALRDEPTPRGDALSYLRRYALAIVATLDLMGDDERRPPPQTPGLVPLTARPPTRRWDSMAPYIPPPATEAPQRRVEPPPPRPDRNRHWLHRLHRQMAHRRVRPHRPPLKPVVPTALILTRRAAGTTFQPGTPGSPEPARTLPFDPPARHLHPMERITAEAEWHFATRVVQATESMPAADW